MSLLAFPSTLRGHVVRALLDLRTCPFSELEINTDGAEVVVQCPAGVGREIAFHRNLAARLLNERGFHVQLRDSLSLVVRRGGDHGA